jgi:hypothetical protein
MARRSSSGGSSRGRGSGGRSRSRGRGSTARSRTAATRAARPDPNVGYLASYRAPANPWTAANAKETLEYRREGYQSLVSVIDAIHGGARWDIALTMMTGNEDTIPDYRRLRSGQRGYNRGSYVRGVTTSTNDVYDEKGDISPLRKVNLASGRADEVTKLLIRQVFFGARDGIIRAIGEKGFATMVSKAQKDHTQGFQEILLESMVSGYNPRTHATPVYDALKSMYRFAATRVDPAKFKKKIPELIKLHVQGELTKPKIYQMAPARRARRTR